MLVSINMGSAQSQREIGGHEVPLSALRPGNAYTVIGPENDIDYITYVGKRRGTHIVLYTDADNNMVPGEIFDNYLRRSRIISETDYKTVNFNY